MHEEDLKLAQQVNDILTKELRTEMKKVVDAGQFVPGQTKTLSEGVCLMLKMADFENWLSGEMNYSNRSYPNHAYAPMRNPNNGQYMTDMYDRPMAYGFNYSGHSTKDRMISRLEDMMGEAKNEYEAKMIRDVIAYIQSEK